MSFYSKNHHRRSIRLKKYDYSQPGAYFITICTHNRRCLFGDILDGQMNLNEFSEIALQCWIEISNHFPNVSLDEFVVMPNHVHGIIWINNQTNVVVQNIESNVGATLAVAQNNIGAVASPAPTIGNIVGTYKSIVANKCLKIFKENNQVMGKLWQRNYYERIIRNERELDKIREYILGNPLRWELDIENSEKKKKYKNIY